MSILHDAAPALTDIEAWQADVDRRVREHRERVRRARELHRFALIEWQRHVDWAAERGETPPARPELGIDGPAENRTAAALQAERERLAGQRQQIVAGARQAVENDAGEVVDQAAQRARELLTELEQVRREVAAAWNAVREVRAAVDSQERRGPPEREASRMRTMPATPAEYATAVAAGDDLLAVVPNRPAPHESVIAGNTGPSQTARFYAEGADPAEAQQARQLLREHRQPTNRTRID